MQTSPDVQWVSTSEQIEELAREVEHERAVALDTEFHGERTYIPLLMLLQVATRRRVYLVDPLSSADLTPLLRALTREGLRVVGHALRHDIEILYLRHGVLLNGVFDTQVAAAFLGHGFQVGLSDLLDKLLSVRLQKETRLADWSRRPLPTRQAEYAANDVRYLLPVYETMARALAKEKRLAWVLDECSHLTHPDRYERVPERAYKRVRGYGRLEPRDLAALRELAAERDRLAAELDMVPHFLLPDADLMRLVDQKPVAVKELRSSGRPAHPTIERYAPRWLAAVERGAAAPLAVPKRQRRQVQGAGPELVTRAMRVVADVAHRHGIAAPLLVQRRGVEGALRASPNDRGELVEALGLDGWREGLLADALWDALRERLGGD